MKPQSVKLTLISMIPTLRYLHVDGFGVRLKFRGELISRREEIMMLLEHEHMRSAGRDHETQMNKEFEKSSCQWERRKSAA
jgi:hypothetical protein